MSTNKNTMDVIEVKDKKVVYQSPESNKDHIYGKIREHVLEKCMKTSLKILEVSSATGQHISYFASVCKKDYPTISIEWTPSDYEDEIFESIQAYVEEAKLDSVKDPILLDASKPTTWAVTPSSLDLIININMIHIAPWWEEEYKWK